MIHIQKITKQYGSKILFEEADAHIGSRARVALIGPNGSGKSTLVRILLGLESADSGKVTRPQHLTIGHLAQEVSRDPSQTILDEVMKLDGRREALLSEKSELEARFAEFEPEPSELDRYGQLLEEVEGMDEYRLEARAKEILSGMGFRVQDFSRKPHEFSGGWLMRVALCRVLLMEPDLLLLDEPTNHLDLESLLWLERFLLAFRRAVLVISHDTAFLNRIVTEVLEVDQRKLTSYRGNLEAYQTQKHERMAVLRAQYDGQQAKVAEIEKFVSRFGAKATKARQAQSRLKQLEKMDLIELPDDRQVVRFRFPETIPSGKEVVTARGLGVRFGNHQLFQDVNWVIPRGARIAIVGVNGAGKSALLKLLSGEMDPSSGSLVHGHQVRIGYYAQHQAEGLKLDRTVLEELEATAPQLPISQIRGVAGAFLLQGDAVEKKCGVLSGGEKARVALAKLLLSPANFLILDEPTNHLDVESRGVLMEALQDYEGTLCLVSHDRAFMAPLVDQVLEITPATQGQEGGRIHQLLGGYEDYLAKKLKEVDERDQDLSRTGLAPQASGGGRSEKSESEKGTTPLHESTMSTAPSHNKKRSWEREVVQTEKDIARVEEELALLHELLADPRTYEDKPRSMTLLEDQRKKSKFLEEKLSRWEELCNLLG